MKQFNYQTGKTGETIAADFLIQKGFKIIDKNFHTRFGEIDLIATYKGKLIFIEVKLKVGDRFGTPEEMINKAKIMQVKKTAQMYILKNPEIASKYPSYRVDAVCIVLNQDKSVERITHYENLI